MGGSLQRETQVTAGVPLLDGWFSKSTVRAVLGLLHRDLTKDCQTLWGLWTLPAPYCSFNLNRTSAPGTGSCEVQGWPLLGGSPSSHRRHFQGPSLIHMNPIAVTRPLALSGRGDERCGEGGVEGRGAAPVEASDSTLASLRRSGDSEGGYQRVLCPCPSPAPPPITFHPL